MEQFNLLQKIILMGIPMIFAITVHETAHGIVANLLGDPTAKQLGRLTLNPSKHVDLLGTILIPLLLLTLGGFIFGWAKPVPIDETHFKKPKRDKLWVALAGPLSNFIMALGWALVAKIGVSLYYANGLKAGFILASLGGAGITVNCLFAALNLIPIPPLDGSRLISYFLNERLLRYYDRMEPYGLFIVLGLAVLGILNKMVFPLFSVFISVISALFHLEQLLN